jgi:hypothetical protein
MTDNIFGNPEGVQPEATQQAPVNPQEPQAPAQVTDPSSLFANQLAGIMADDGRQKYADVPTALASIPHAQDHIRALTEEAAALKEELSKRAGVDEVLQRLESNQNQPEQPSVNGLDATAVNAQVEQILTQREQAAVATRNQATVVNALTAKFGDNAETAFAEKAAQLGVDVGFLTEISLRSPEAALAYFEVAPARVSNPTSGGVNTTALPSTPVADDSHMDVFRGGQSDLVTQWRKAAKPT